MSAAPNDAENLNSQTPVQVLKSFFDHHSTDQVRLTLLQTMQNYALNENKGFLDLNMDEQQIAEVFDGLIALVGAVQTLMDDGKIAGMDG
jgi:hypothetical protein